MFVMDLVIVLYVIGAPLAVLAAVAHILATLADRH